MDATMIANLVAKATNRADIKNAALRAQREARAQLAHDNAIALAEIATTEREINSALSLAFKAQDDADRKAINATSNAPAPAPKAPKAPKADLAVVSA